MGLLNFLKKKKESDEAPKVEANSKPSKPSGKTPKVIVYSTQTCPFCIKTKEFLKENNIPFTTKDVGTNQKYAQEMIKKSGQQGVPVIDINGKIIIGFNGGGQLKKALGI